MINQQELEAKIIELSLWSRGSFGKSCFYGQLLVDLSSFNWNKYDGLEQICRLRNVVACRFFYRKFPGRRFLKMADPKVSVKPNWPMYFSICNQNCRPRAPISPYIVPYKGDLEVELLFKPPSFSENSQITEGSIKIHILGAKNLIPANHNIRIESQCFNSYVPTWATADG